MSSKYRIIQIDNFIRNLKDFNKANQKKIVDKIKEWLSVKPDRWAMLEGKIYIRGKKIFGLRHIKIGVKGYRGGAYVLYRICHECKENKYWEKSDVRCEFCTDDSEDHTVVLFDVHPRGHDYKR